MMDVRVKIDFWIKGSIKLLRIKINERTVNSPKFCLILLDSKVCLENFTKDAYRAKRRLTSPLPVN